VAVSQFNLWSENPSWRDDLRTLVRRHQPDLIGLSETYDKSASTLAPAGYRAWLPVEPRHAQDTAVLWRDDWTLLASGSAHMSAEPDLRFPSWRLRRANWATLRTHTGAVVSVIAVHPNPVGIDLHEYLRNLGGLVARLSARGPVFVPGDFNVRYEGDGYPVRWVSAAGLMNPYDTLGAPVGGTGRHGGTIDWVLASASLTAVRLRTLSDLGSDHVAVTVEFAP